MGFPTLKSVFGPSVEGFKDAIKEGKLERCEVSTEGRSLTAWGYFAEYITRAEVYEVCEALRNSLSLHGVKLNVRFPKECYSALAAEDIALELRASNVMLNGYFNSAEFNVHDGADKNSCTNITLKFGGMETIKECDFERQFGAIIAQRFGIETQLGFDGQLE